AERAIARPAVVADEPAAGGQERGRGGVGGRAPGPSAGLEVESGDRVALLGIVDERGAEVQVADALEDRLVARDLGELRPQQAADRQVPGLPLALVDQRVRGLMDPVVEEAVADRDVEARGRGRAALRLRREQ